MAPRKASKLVPTTAKPPNSNPTQTKFIECVQRTFAKQHFKLLRLDYGTNFFDPYSKIFSEGVDVCEIDIRTKNDALVLLKEKRIDLWLHLMNNLVSSNRFVGHGPIQSIMELILTINPKFDETSDRTFRRIQSASLLFENIVDNFPPSWSICSNIYKNLFYSPINIEIDFRKIRMNSNDGFFQIILALLEDAFMDTDSDDESANENAFDSMMNFQQFEKIESEKCCYTKLSRTEKINRLFVVLSLLIKLMEIDLSIWIQRYPFETRNFMSNPDTCPLIAHLLWKGKDCGEINMMVRHILKVFTMAIWINFPDDKTDILARLVGCTAAAINLSENSKSENLITYPNIQRLTEAFASEMIKSIELFPYTVQYYINIIDKIRSPVISMLVCLRILSKFTKEFENISLRKIVDSVSNESFKNYEEKLNDSAIRHRKSDTYPAYDPKRDKKMPKHLKINREEFLVLVLNLFKSYIGVHRTHELLQSLLSDNMTTSTDMDIEQYNKLHEKIQNEKDHRLDFDQLNKDWERLKSVAKKSASTDMIPNVPLVQCQNVYLEPSEFFRCQEDMEYFVKLNGILERNVQLGDTFKMWRTAIDQCKSN